MQKKRLSRWLCAVLVGVLLGMSGVYGFFIPEMGKRLVQIYPEYASRYSPWLVFIYLTAIPCLGILLLGWKITQSIGTGRVFCHKNGSRCRMIAQLFLGDTVFFFLGNLVFLFFDWSHPAVLLASICLLFIGIAAAVVFFTLSQLVEEAARLQEENQMTI